VARSLPLQIYVSRDLSHRVRLAAANRRLSVSEYVRSLLVTACDGDDPASQCALTVERIHRQSVFVMVGVDALLAGHSDRALRDRAHHAYARRCKQLGIASTALEGIAK
jgi:hypothetical protein